MRYNKIEKDCLLIVKYANRKYYDTMLHRYINITKVLELAEMGLQLKVVEHKTQKDISTLTLLRAQVAREVAKLEDTCTQS